MSSYDHMSNEPFTIAVSTARLRQIKSDAAMHGFWAGFLMGCIVAGGFAWALA